MIPNYFFVILSCCFVALTAVIVIRNFPRIYRRRKRETISESDRFVHLVSELEDQLTKRIDAVSKKSFRIARLRRRVQHHADLLNEITKKLNKDEGKA